ncbi:homocysteine-responsive endoplasmic reticulum-resident ubiquitin-like domain member 1 protein [Nerophis ophidion]|uniref:homocysteine-responsive endoplasmic reticulum-resident ubiquitin-like domain member 1 protein n=1 Tax=Nerophis ophidion TaxID=159077 RepID=UPI002ADF5634|nr:homocysteine-responsive endoplasmic reticulum-resident ubiquitin-like domain member 1 protein [Nerophis ophidion]
MEVGDSPGETMTILVKTASQAVEDQTVDGVRWNWTVKELKTHLSAVYPTKPTESDQRLIFAGKLLPDHLSMRDLFRQTDLIPTLHLVFAVRTQKQSPEGERAQETEQPHLSLPSPTPPSPRSTAVLRQRRETSSNPAATQVNTQSPAPPQHAPAWPGNSVSATSPMTQTAFPAYSLYSPQQLLWLQHVYAQQYLMQYHAALAAAGTAPAVSPATVGQLPAVHAHQVPVPAPIANQNHIHIQPANQNPAQDGAFIDPAIANQNMRMNAQGGPVMEDEEDLERDWLDWLYSAARLGVMLMIVYFNSSLSHFLLVMATLFIMYLHTTGWFTLRRREQAPGPNQLHPPEVQNNQENENRIPNPAAVGQMEGAADNQEPMTAVLVPPNSSSIMWTVWVFLKTFFSSLIPDGRQGVAN